MPFLWVFLCAVYEDLNACPAGYVAVARLRLFPSFPLRRTFPANNGDRKLCEKTHSTDAVFSIETRHRAASSIRTLGIPVKRWGSKMKTFIAALLATSPVRHTRDIAFLKVSPLSVIIAFSLIAVLAALYAATHYPLPEAIYAVPMITD
jgi:hypothetical protein